jgi:hypothetical protein
LEDIPVLYVNLIEGPAAVTVKVLIYFILVTLLALEGLRGLTNIQGIKGLCSCFRKGYARMISHQNLSK